MALKTTIRYSLIIFTLGLFSSCAEQFREIRGSENRGNAFLGTGLAKSTQSAVNALFRAIQSLVLLLKCGVTRTP
jgi:hypothetical protein